MSLNLKDIPALFSTCPDLLLLVSCLCSSDSAGWPKKNWDFRRPKPPAVEHRPIATILGS